MTLKEKQDILDKAKGYINVFVLETTEAINGNLRQVEGLEEELAKFKIKPGMEILYNSKYDELLNRMHSVINTRKSGGKIGGTSKTILEQWNTIEEFLLADDNTE